MSKLATDLSFKNIDYTCYKWYKYVKLGLMITMINEIELLKQKLDKEIEQGCSYEQVLKTSREIDVLLAKYYLEKVEDIT